jgi:MarR-like DNA-binding transcriptional regulator SgrR of sgrS sRNA
LFVDDKKNNNKKQNKNNNNKKKQKTTTTLNLFDEIFHNIMNIELCLQLLHHKYVIKISSKCVAKYHLNPYRIAINLLRVMK